MKKHGVNLSRQAQSETREKVLTSKKTRFTKHKNIGGLRLSFFSFKPSQPNERG